MNFYLLNYSVKGIKSLDKHISLSFYNKTITNNFNPANYNMKGIYGMNGTGKSAIVNSVEILKNLLIDSDYLSNRFVQKELDSLINKATGTLEISIEFLLKEDIPSYSFKYEISIAKNTLGLFVIDYEKLFTKKATSKKEYANPVLSIKHGEIIAIDESDNFGEEFKVKTQNLLSKSTSTSLFIDKFLNTSKNNNKAFLSLVFLLFFSTEIYTYLDQSDKHSQFFIKNIEDYFDESDFKLDELKEYTSKERKNRIRAIYVSNNYVKKDDFDSFSTNVRKLTQFIKVFKEDLKDIEIERKEDRVGYICNLIMVYDDYKINAEFESTGIKKLIKLFAYISKMVSGSIVFIDELDSNIHDVYLCALLEYMIAYGKGQLCFTTHNVGPMDVLKNNAKSIDFISMDHEIYSWTKNGNYSPSKMYREGMIKGSPFNISCIDFIGIIDNIAEDA